jgi:hypothetical protein
MPFHSYTFSPEDGQNVLPIPAKDVLYFPQKQKYAGFLSIGRVWGTYPEHYNSKALGMFRYIYNYTTRKGSGSPYKDYRIVWEIARDDSGLERFTLDRNITSSVKRSSEAIARGTRDVKHEEMEEEAVYARKKLLENDPPCHFSIGIWLYRNTIDELNLDLQALASDMAAAKTERVNFHVQDIWDQSWLFEGGLFQTKPVYRCQKQFASKVVPQIPRIVAPKLDSKGVLFLNKSMRTPTYLDICEVVPNHTAVLGLTGAGKSLLMSEMAIEPLIRGNPTVAFDFPRPDGTSTYRDMVHNLQLCGKKAAYYDVRSPINGIEFVDLTAFKGKTYEDRKKILVSDHVDLLTILVLGAEPLPGEERDYSPAISEMYHDFIEQPEIMKRHEIASRAGFGSTDYKLMPTIESDLMPFLSGEDGWIKRMMKENDDPKSIEIYSAILRRLRGRLDTPLGKSLKSASTLDIDVDFLVMALTEVKADDESLIYANSGFNILTRKAMQSYAATCLCDEGTTLFKLKQFAKKISDYPPTARKYGSNFILGAQVIEPIISSGYSKTIFGNMINKMLGYCSSSIYQEMISPDIGMRPEIAAKYQSDDYVANLQRGESYWYLMRANKHYELTFSCSDLLLAMNSNQVPEMLARERFKKKYADSNNPSDLQWLLDYSKVYAKARRNKIPFDQILPDVKIDMGAIAA